MQLIITLTGINNTSVCYFRSNTTKLVRPIKFRHFSHTHTISDLTLDSYYLLAYQFLRSLPSYHLFLGPTSTLRTLPLTALCTYIHPYPLLAISPGSYYSFHHSDPLYSLLSPSNPPPRGLSCPSNLQVLSTLSNCCIFIFSRLAFATHTRALLPPIRPYPSCVLRCPGKTPTAGFEKLPHQYPKHDKPCTLTILHQASHELIHPQTHIARPFAPSKHFRVRGGTNPMPDSKNSQLHLPATLHIGSELS